MKYLGKKILTLIITLFLVSITVFVTFQIIPGDVVASILGTEATEEREAEVRKELGLDKPVVQRYIDWGVGVLKGDLGKSYRYSKNMNEMMSVSELIKDKLPVTLWLAGVSFIIIIFVSIPLGVLWAGSKSKILDGIIGVLTQISMSIPSFFLGILITYLFGIILKVFTPGSYVSYKDNFVGFIGYLIFPVTANG